MSKLTSSYHPPITAKPHDDSRNTSGGDIERLTPALRRAFIRGAKLIERGDIHRAMQLLERVIQPQASTLMAAYVSLGRDQGELDRRTLGLAEPALSTRLPSRAISKRKRLEPWAEDKQTKADWTARGPDVTPQGRSYVHRTKPR